ncbi:nuclear transport factor 2 family protein [uncultured Croceitalea sp.]|uniref:nuclear transport factor 2 family protein n=1 Tax=uncultured Croceitalea sp. TaxID=1798908 RepID=UPI00330643F7
MNDEIRKMLDKFQITELAYKFSDAANKRDGEGFKKLWAKDGAKWVIGPPVNFAFEGKEDMGKNLVAALGQWEFFVQLTTFNVIDLHGDTATARFYVHETANAKSGAGNNNLSYYQDELVKEEGHWRFKTRTYHTLFQSHERQIGDIIEIPQD